MYSSFEQTEQFQNIDQRSKSLVELIRASVSPAKKNVPILAGTALDLTQWVYVITEGVVSYARDGRVLLYFEEGDLIGIEGEYHGSHAQIIPTFAVRVDIYHREDLLGELSRQPSLALLWSEYLALQTTLYLAVIAALAREVDEVEPRIINFRAGEILISPTTPSSQAYTLVQGQASVHAGPDRVGILRAEQIFGALAALSGTPYSATVVADEPCIALALRRAQFVSLLKAREMQLISVFPTANGALLL